MLIDKLFQDQEKRFWWDEMPAFLDQLGFRKHTAEIMLTVAMTERMKVMEKE